MSELVLLPAELFLVSKLCNGSHLNYDYIAMLPDIQQRVAINKENCIRGLEEKGVVEDFWGEVTVKSKAKEFLAPIWDGNFDATVTIMETDELTVARTLYIHRLSNHIVLVSLMEDGLHIQAVQEDDLDEIVWSLIPNDYEKKTVPSDCYLRNKKPQQTIVFKNLLTSGERAVIESFYLVDGWICMDAEDSGYQIIMIEDYLSVACSILKGEE